MPLYTWKCDKCTQLTEVIRPMSEYETPPEKCDHCESVTFAHSVIIRPGNVKGYILLGDTGWHDKEYTKYRSVRG